MKNFLKCERGNFAVIFALASVPIFSAVGMAVDYTRATNVQAVMQNHVDAATLSGVRDGQAGNPSPDLSYMRTAIRERFGTGDWIDNLKVTGKWLSQSDFQITATGEVPVTFLAAVPGFPEAVKVGASAVAHLEEPRLVYKPPTVSELDPSASDYNQIAVYCFDPTKKRDPETYGRTQMTVIADNAGNKYDYVMPRCANGQNMSYKLTNVRNARTRPRPWESNGPGRYDYYTDTTIKKKGAEKYDLGGWDILETVLCNNQSECDPSSKNSKIPEGANRKPQRATKGCAPGKYMYYGWEDRPPGNGDWTDQDYNDIRIVISCPTEEKIGERVVRLTR